MDTIQKFKIFDFEFEFRGVHEFERTRGEFEFERIRANSNLHPYQLLGEVLDQGLKELGYSREDLSVVLVASDRQHVLDLYCSKGKNCSYKLYWPSFGMAYGNPRFSELGKVLTKVALESSRMVLCSPDWGAHGSNEYW